MNPVTELVDLATYRKAERMAGGKLDALMVYAAYAQDRDIYREGRIVTADEATYRRMKAENSNDIVNKFGQVYAQDTPLLLYLRLADVLIDAAIDLRDRHGQFTVVMDGLRTHDSGLKMQQRRPDLVALGLLAKAGSSAHNRALAVDSKLFIKEGDALIEADEHGHLDDLDMTASSRFYPGPMSDEARANRRQRLQAWQRASIKNHLPMANLLSEFWDDRVPGSPADMWRVLSCRALCIGADGNPHSNSIIAGLRDATKHMTTPESAEAAHALFAAVWDKVFSLEQKQQLDTLLGPGGGSPPPLKDFLFHEWLDNIHDKDLQQAGYRPQTAPSL